MLTYPTAFQSDLGRYIQIAWDNEQAFLANFWEWESFDEMQLLEFYMADTTSKIIVLANSGKTLTTTITTSEYLEWAQDITKI